MLHLVVVQMKIANILLILHMMEVLLALLKEQFLIVLQTNAQIQIKCRFARRRHENQLPEHALSPKCGRVPCRWG